MAFVNLFLICVLAAGVGVKREAQDKVYKFVSTQPPTSAPAATSFALTSQELGTTWNMNITH